MKKIAMCFLLMIGILLLNSSCSYNQEKEEKCEDLDFAENTNAEQVCTEIYEYYDTYLGGKLENHVSCDYDNCIMWCVNDNFFEEIKPANSSHQDYLNACDNFISGAGGFGEIYLPSEYEESLIQWCANNFSVSDNYLNCTE